MRWDYGTIYKKIRKSKHISQEEVCAVVLLNLYDYRITLQERTCRVLNRTK